MLRRRTIAIEIDVAIYIYIYISRRMTQKQRPFRLWCLAAGSDSGAEESAGGAEAGGALEPVVP